MDALAKQTLIEIIAADKLLGVTEEDIGKKLQISKRQVRNVLTSPEYKEYMRTLASEARERAMTIFLANFDRLTKKATKALEKNLDDNKMDAVRVVVEVLGLKQQPTENNSASNITVIMPGAERPAIEVKSDSIQNEP